MNDCNSLTAAYEQLRTEANQYVKTHPDEAPLMEAICYGQGNNPKLLSAGSCVQLVGWVLAELVRPNVVTAKAYRPLVEMLLSAFDISPARTKMQERLDNTMAILDDKHMGQPTNILEQLRLCWVAASELEIDPSRASSLGKRSVSCLDDRLYWRSDITNLRKVVKWLSQWLNGSPHQKGHYLIVECIRLLQIDRADVQVMTKQVNAVASNDLRHRSLKPSRTTENQEIHIHVTVNQGAATATQASYLPPSTIANSSGSLEPTSTSLHPKGLDLPVCILIPYSQPRYSRLLVPSGQATVADMLWQLERQCRLQETFLLLRCYGPTWTEGDACMSSCGPDQTDISLDALGITNDTYLTFYYIRPNQPEYYSQPPEQASIHSANASSSGPQAGGNESMPSASPYCPHQPRNSLQHPEQTSISPAVAPSFDHQDGGNEGMQPVSPYYRSTEDFSTAHARGQPSYDIGDFVRAHDLTGAVSMTILVPTRILPQRVLRNADTLGTSIFEQLKRTYNDTMGLLSYARGKLLPTMVLLEFGFGGPVSLVGFAIVALGLQLHGADPRMQQLVVRLPSTERYSDKLTQEGQGFPTQVRFVNKSYFLHTSSLRWNSTR